MITPNLPGVTWRKSSYSNNGGNCVEIAHLDDGRVAVRDSKANGAGPVLVFLPLEWDAFARGMKAGEFDRGA